MIKAIVLDIGGVLVRTEDHTARRELEKRYHLPAGSIHQLVFNSPAAVESTLGRADSNKIWEFVAETLSIDKEGLHEFKKNFWKGDQLDHEVLNFLQECRVDYITALLTNAWKHARKTLANEYSIKEGKTVDHILISSELGVAKPDPEIYRILAETLACDYGEILFVDDFIENIRSASALGIETIHYHPGINLINEIQSILDKD